MSNREKQRKALDPRYDQYYAGEFAKHNQKKTVPIVRPQTIGADIFHKFGEFAVRRPDEFTRPLKTKDIGNIRLAYALHLFGKYPVPYHLQTVWSKEGAGATRYGTPEHLAEERRTLDKRSLMLKRMFITVGVGRSLYKDHTKDFFTKKETHNFLTCPMKLSFEEAVYYALAKSHTTDIGIVTRIYKSKLASKDYRQEFWRDVVRFFCVNAIPINEMNDLIDFLNDIRLRDQDYSLKGRSVSSLKIQMEQWHRMLARTKRMGNAKWEGIAIPDIEYPDMRGNATGNNCDWKMIQLTTSKDLANEGSNMHHCVYSYQRACILGRTSIWSLRRKNKKDYDYTERALTVEVNNVNGKVVQIRGYANRVARPYELDVVKRWISENNLMIAY